MTDSEREAIALAYAKRQAAKIAYDKARESIEPLRKAWVDADHAYVMIWRPHNGKEKR